MKLRPVVLLNHPHTPALAQLVLATVDDRTVTRAYLQLVTRHNVAPDTAKKLLGLTK